MFACVRVRESASNHLCMMYYVMVALANKQFLINKDVLHFVFIIWRSLRNERLAKERLD